MREGSWKITLGRRRPVTRFGISAALLALAVVSPFPEPLRHVGAVPLAGQELRGWLVLEGEPGYLTNGYLDPHFPVWDPSLETGFVQAGATGVLERSGDRMNLLLAGTARRSEFLEDLPAWQAYLLRGRVARRLGSGMTGSLDVAFAEGRQPDTRRTLWAQTSARWAPSPALAFRAGPGIAVRRLAAGGEATPGDGLPGLPPPAGDGGAADALAGATSYFLSAGVEAWSGTRWRWEAEAFASHTEAPDLGLDARGAGARLRVTRWIGAVRLEAGSGLEGFGYRAALNGGLPEEQDGPPPEDDLLWRGDLAFGIPLGERTELRAGFAGVNVLGSDGDRGLDWRASAGLRVSLGGSLSRSKPRLWEPMEGEGGMRVRVPYDGAGRLYLTGDFNGWASPGIPLERGADGAHTGRVPLEPGSYRYLIRVVKEDGSEDWLELPEGALLVDDGFGGQNGLLIVGDSS